MRGLVAIRSCFRSDPVQLGRLLRGGWITGQLLQIDTKRVLVGGGHNDNRGLRGHEVYEMSLIFLNAFSPLSCRCGAILLSGILRGGWLREFVLQIHSGRVLVGRCHDDDRGLW